jgi:sugar phosphate isomerase/epimerase
MLTRRDILSIMPLLAVTRAAAQEQKKKVGSLRKVACQTNAWQHTPGNFQELLDLLARIKRFGYEGFETNVRDVQDQFASAAQARAQIEATGLKFFGPHCNINSPIESFNKTSDGAAALGASHIVVSGGGSFKNGKLDEAVLTHKVEALTAVSKIVKERGLRLVYHNHKPEFVENGAESEELLRRTDPELVNLLLDQGHAFEAKADVNAFFARHSNRIDAMHIRDLRDDKQVPLGQGEYDFKTLAAEIKKTGWSGWLETEEELRTKDFQLADSTVQSDREFFRKMFGV